LSVVA
jgi:hypothetical protein